MQPGTAAVQVVQAPPKPPDYIIFSIVVLLCCNLLFGIIALIFSLQSDSSYKAGRFEDARKHGHTAKIINIAGVIITAIIVVIVIIVYVLLLLDTLSRI